MVLNSIAFDRAASYYDETRGFPPGEEQTAAALISQTGGLTPASKVIEIGVGTGRIALPLARHVGVYFGVDISRPMMARLRAKQNGEPISLLEGDATRLPFASHSFDAAVAVHVFHLIPNWQAVLQELARVLREGAPLLHCWGEPDTFKSLGQVWRASLPPRETEVVGVRFDYNPTFLFEQGWTPAGETATHSYSYEMAPQKFLDQLKNRIWSQTWRLTDAQLASAVQAVETVMRTEYPNPEQPVGVTSNFNVRAYLPPKVE
jgi:SAM-dependent methyltransferase